MSPGRYRCTVLLCLSVFAFLAAGCGAGERTDAIGRPATVAGGGFDGARAFADLAEQVDIGPRPTGSKAAAATAMLIDRKLKEAGAKEVQIQFPLNNVVATLPGSKPGYIVVGAHYDTKDSIPGFVGANDGASGVAVVLELVRSLPRPLPGPSVAIALFDGEEAHDDLDFAKNGKRGSTQYVDFAEREAQATPPIDEIRAMVLLDMIGDCDLQVPLEPNSGPALYQRFADADPDVFSGTTTPIDDDHVPFVDRGVAALDVIDFTYGSAQSPGPYWHTAEDTLDKVCPESLDAVGEAALDVIPAIR
ncbi:MAG: Zn-dependent exopeptidase M28 [Solirubrobacterales bacterium]|nr:Zn-dependent exopeptidase M28 [Solirubrobacterales bacterium]